jgi:hypothetical protein
MAQQNNPKLTITLTGLQPVTIIEDDWPLIACAEDTRHLTVRQHQDGRAIVYGYYCHDTASQHAVRKDCRHVLVERAPEGDW